MIRSALFAAALVFAVLAFACRGDGATSDSDDTTATQSPSGASATAAVEVAARPSPGCSLAAPPAGVSERTLMVGAESGTYREMVPSVAAELEPLPLIIDVPGRGARVDKVALAHDFETLGERQGAFVLTPNGIGPASAPGDNNNPAFLNALLDASEQRLCIDMARIFLGGISWGARISSTVGCQLADRIAAIGAVSGVVYDATCELSRPLPIMVFHGKLDTLVQYYGGIGYNLIHPTELAPPPPTSPPAETSGFPPVETIVAQWAAANGCRVEPEITQISETIELRTFVACAEGSAVDFYVISDGQHAWPGADLEVYNQICPGCLVTGILPTQEIRATALLWDFWMRHPLSR